MAYREDIGEVKAAMQEAFDRLMETDHRFHILEPLDIHGVTAFGDSAVMVRVRIKTRPGMQWAAGRAYNEILKQVFDRQGHRNPVPARDAVYGRRQGRPLAPAEPQAYQDDRRDTWSIMRDRNRPTTTRIRSPVRSTRRARWKANRPADVRMPS